MKKLFLTALTAAAFSVSALAQTYQEGNTTYEFEPYNYLQFQAGVQHTVGEIKASDLLSPNAAISFGRQFSPVMGMRIGLGGWQSKGGWVNPYNDYSYNYVALNADAVFNITNMFRQWKPFQKFNLSAFVGIAGNLAFGNDEANDLAAQNFHGINENFGHIWDGSKLSPVGRAGLIADFRCNDRWSFNVEANANVTTDHYNSKHADNADFYFNGLVGLSYKLSDGYKKTVREEKVEEPVAPVAKCDHCGKPLADCQYGGNHPKCATCGKFLDECQYNGNHPAPKAEPFVRNIFFERNKDIISAAEGEKIVELANYLNEHPQAKVSLVGYADKGTGNAKINERLSVKRAAAVVKFLKDKCHIDASRVASEDHKGDTVQPFVVNDENRVCICIAE